MSRGLIEYLGTWLLDHPEELVIEELEGERGELIFEITVNSEDMGKLIGKRGRIIQALRALVRVAAQRDGQTILVEVVD
jgi:predicted RNA-binding protein YlqC (UPF0109 family)